MNPFKRAQQTIRDSERFQREAQQRKDDAAAEAVAEAERIAKEAAK